MLREEPAVPERRGEQMGEEPAVPGRRGDQMGDEIRNITEEDIARINELYHKSKTAAGLTQEEKQEQAALRSAYIRAVRRNLRGTLDNIDVVDRSGRVTSLAKKHDGSGTQEN